MDINKLTDVINKRLQELPRDGFICKGLRKRQKEILKIEEIEEIDTERV